MIEEDGRWRSPDSAGGDDSKRGYEDIFAPLEFEGLMIDKQTLYYDTEALQDYYRGLPSYTHPFKDPKGNFIIDWTDIGNYNATDIWTEIYNIACGSRPLSDWQTIVDEYEASVKVVNSGMMTPSESLKMASVMVTTIPIILIYPFMQKYFTKGLMIGSVKG